MKVSLVVASGIHAGREIPIAGTRFLIGRKEGCDLRPASPAISLKHCVVLIRDGHVFLQDLGSTNGTLVNNLLLCGDEERPLADGDLVKVGPLDFTLRIGLWGVGDIREASQATPTPSIPAHPRGLTPVGVSHCSDRGDDVGNVHQFSTVGPTSHVLDVLKDLVVELRSRRYIYVSNPTAVDLARYFDAHPLAILDLSRATGHPVVTVDIAQHVISGRFNLQSVMRGVFTQLVSLHGLKLESDDFHEQLVPQILKDEQPHLFMIFNIDPIDLEAIHYFRGLVQCCQLVVMAGTHSYYNSTSQPIPKDTPVSKGVNTEYSKVAASELLKKYMKKPR